MSRSAVNPSRAGAGDDPPAAIKHAAAEWKTRVDAGLSSNEEVELQAWLEADPRHRAAFDRFDAVWAKFDRPVETGVTTELLRALAVRSSRRRRRVLSAGASLALLVIGGFSWWTWERSRETERAPAVASSPPMPTNAVVLVPARQQLPDGSVAELREGAAIKVDYSAGIRRVLLLHGEAHFQVTKDASRPFVVAAGGVEARAVGTAFSVQLRSDAVEILVTEGRVAVDQPPASSPNSPAIDPPAAPPPLAVVNVGHGIVVDRAAQSVTPPQVTSVRPDELEERLAWRAPRVEFTRTSLAEAVAVLNGYSAGRRSAGHDGVRFVIQDPALGEVRVSGLFRVDKTEAFIELLKNGFGIEAKTRGDGEIILSKARADGGR